MMDTAHGNDDSGDSNKNVNIDMSWEEKLAKELPKVELHLHLDGSLSPGKFTMYFKERRESFSKAMAVSQ